MKEDKLYQVLELYNEAMVDSYKPLEKEWTNVNKVDSKIVKIKKLIVRPD